MFDFKGKRLHFIGIGGVGVNALANFAHDFGAEVSGSDIRLNNLCSMLLKKGVNIWQGENECAMSDADTVVYSSAIKPDNRELTYARSHNIATFERFEFLGEISKHFGCVIAIAGTHGKTSTTAMTAHILKKENKNFLAMIGGESVDYSNYVNNIYGPLENSIFLCEACEYKMSLLSLNPDIGVVTNVECDHPDCYENLQNVKTVFSKFLSQSKIKIVSCENRDLLETYHDRTVDKEKTQSAADSENNDEHTAIRDCEKTLSSRKFSILEKSADDISEHNATLYYDKDTVVSMETGKSKFVLTDDGEYNYINAAFAVRAARCIGISEKESAKRLLSYRGVKRRFEKANNIDNVPVFFDFAHHPTEIKNVLRRASVYGNLLVVFQPHTYSRTKAYLNEFVLSLCDEHIKTLVLMPTYAARELPEQGADSGVLASAIIDKNCINDVYLADSAKSTLDYVVSHVNGHDAIMFIGAGDIYDLRLLF